MLPGGGDSGSGRRRRRRVAVIMLEGASLDETAAVREAIAARDAGITLLVVGISERAVPPTEWLGVANYPTNINVFAVADYHHLPAIVNRLIVSVTNGSRPTNEAIYSMLERA